MEEFNEGDIVVRKDRAVDDRRKWVIVKVFKETLWLKPIIGGIIVDDFLYKEVRKEIMEVIGRRKEANERKMTEYMKMEFPNICPFCGNMVMDVVDYIDNHLAVHFPVAGRQFLR